MSNRLAGEKSPYLLQHAQNPVDWHPWGEEAFRKAAGEDKPIFLSIGYATCHWCHVMEHESFEDQEVAGLLNADFVSIKVDREERPDIDQVYMTVCQVLTGSGGWPLSIFMTPDRRPFFVGSYFPKTNRMGRPGFVEVLGQIAAIWKTRREELDKIGGEVTRAIQPKPAASEAGLPVGLDVLEKAYLQLSKSFDPTWGGFGSAPKFPTPHHLTFLLRFHRRKPASDALAMVEKTLDAMRAGGLFDHVGFGFHRYSVDERWLVPHFEKMLYDQAMLAMAYVEAHLASGDARHARTAREIFEYVLRDMRSPEGGFYSAEDADSEGEEGKFYVWTPAEVEQVLGKEAADVFCRFYDITPEGNFDNRWSIPHVARPVELRAPQFGMDPETLSCLLEGSRKKLFSAREKRVRPLKDDKVLAAWNGLMIAALAKGYQALGDPAYAEAARAAADFVLDVLRPKSLGGRLHRRYRDGEVAHRAFADDYAFLIWGLIELYESVFEVRRLEEAIALQNEMTELFGDAAHGGFYYTGSDGERMIVREKDLQDGAVPSANSVSVLNLLRLGSLTGDPRWEKQAQRAISIFSSLASDFPSAFTQFLNAVDFAIGPAKQIVIAADEAEGADGADEAGGVGGVGGVGEASEADDTAMEMVRTVHRMFLPNRALVLRVGAGQASRLAAIAPLVERLGPIDGKPTAYVCENYSCKRPVTGIDQLKSLLGAG